ncbi:NUDIX hydrolase [Egicoccus halophilus]|uniref:NUDIX hydrolase n=1 Tax=Egicoccus halophilus TaxID=1670830 RepID=A0A8J3EQM8_9ACTN|nr:NUDIX domain-containing protein [Egicoccus halophilus]GGI02688.1 NUDIX hydrolase [Egicoccus halophilus]
MPEQERTAAGRLEEGSTAPAVDAASVLLLREHDAGPQVLMLERHLRADFAGGALVFPGGKVADMDGGLDAARWVGDAPTRWQERLGTATTSQAQGLLVAAVRETFEEVGVLLAQREDGTPLTDEDLRSRSFVEARRRLCDRGGSWDWRRWLEDEELVLDLRLLRFWSWWVTPEGQHRRFDTRFFLARLPKGQTASPDDVESTEVRWSRPDEVLDAGARGEAVVIFPTRCNLRQLADFPSVDAAWRAATEDAVDQRRIQPTIVRRDGEVLVQHPDGGDPEPI